MHFFKGDVPREPIGVAEVAPYSALFKMSLCRISVFRASFSFWPSCGFPLFDWDLENKKSPKYITF
mgnify:CR=1 FL=1